MSPTRIEKYPKAIPEELEVTICSDPVEGRNLRSPGESEAVLTIEFRDE